MSERLTDFSLTFNRSHVIKDYPRIAEMLADDVDPIPLTLIQWSQSINGIFRQEPEGMVRLKLLPREWAKVTATGIVFKTRRYTCSLAETNSWFIKARREEWPIEVIFHPNYPQVIYLVPNPALGITMDEKCSLIISEDNEPYKNMTFKEIEHIAKEIKKTEKALKEAELKEKMNLHKRTRDKNREADQEFRDARQDAQPMSKTASVRAIPENRQAEREHQRKIEQDQWPGFIPDSETPTLMANKSATSADDFSDESDVSDDNTSMFRRIADRKRNQNVNQEK